MALDKRTRQKLEAELAVLLRKGRLQRATVVLRAILEKDPDDDRLLVKLAELSLKLGDVDGVRTAFRGAASAAERKGFYLRAMAALRQLARYQPPHERPWSELSTLAMRLGLVGDALGFLDEGIRAWEEAGDRPAVLQALRRTHGLAPDDVHRTLRLSLELRRDGHHEEALDLLAGEARRHQAAGRDDAWLDLSDARAALLPDDLALACQVAAALLARGEPRKAVQRLQPHVRAGATDLEPLRLLVRAFQALGQDSKRLAAIRLLARALAALGRATAARVQWEALLAADPTDQEARQALGLLAVPAPAPAPILAPATQRAAGAPSPAPLHARTPAPVVARQGPPSPAPTPPSTRAPATVVASAPALTTAPPITPAPALAPRDRPAASPPASLPALPAEPDEELIDLAIDGVEIEEELPAAAAAYADLDDDLAHAGFLVAHRFSEEARSLLAALQADHPGHPGVTALRARLDAGPERVAPHPVAQPATSLPPPELLRAPPQEDDAGEPVDLDLLGAVELVPADEVLARFQQQVALAVAPDDAATHYDLGIAYREMGLLGEAQAEFEQALASAAGPRAVDCLMGVALCQAARGDPARAARTLKHALAHPAVTPVGAAAALYELGVLREQAGDAAAAARSFLAAERAQPRFRDAAARAERLRPGASPDGQAPGLDLLPSGA